MIWFDMFLRMYIYIYIQNINLIQYDRVLYVLIEYYCIMIYIDVIWYNMIVFDCVYWNGRQYNVKLYGAIHKDLHIFYSTLPYHTILYFTWLYYTACTILDYTILYFTIPYYTLLYFTVLYWKTDPIPCSALIKHRNILCSKQSHNNNIYIV